MIFTQLKIPGIECQVCPTLYLDFFQICWHKLVSTQELKVQNSFLIFSLFSAHK